jgi:hypothetical protein
MRAGRLSMGGRAVFFGFSKGMALTGHGSGRKNVPSGAEARVHLGGFTYGLKPVPFNPGRSPQPSTWPAARQRRLDTQEAARFLSYPGILLESWRGLARSGWCELRSGLGVPGEGRVEQEANGSWVRDRQAGAERDFERAALRQPGFPSLNFRLDMWPEPGPGGCNGPDEVRVHSRRQIHSGIRSIAGWPVP